VGSKKNTLVAAAPLRFAFGGHKAQFTHSVLPAPGQCCLLRSAARPYGRDWHQCLTGFFYPSTVFGRQRFGLFNRRAGEFGGQRICEIDPRSASRPSATKRGRDSKSGLLLYRVSARRGEYGIAQKVGSVIIVAAFSSERTIGVGPRRASHRTSLGFIALRSTAPLGGLQAEDHIKSAPVSFVACEQVFGSIEYFEIIQNLLESRHNHVAGRGGGSPRNPV